MSDWLIADRESKEQKFSWPNELLIQEHSRWNRTLRSWRWSSPDAFCKRKIKLDNPTFHPMPSSFKGWLSNCRWQWSTSELAFIWHEGLVCCFGKTRGPGCLSTSRSGSAWTKAVNFSVPNKASNSLQVGKIKLGTKNYRQFVGLYQVLPYIISCKAPIICSVERRGLAHNVQARRPFTPFAERTATPPTWPPSPRSDNSILLLGGRERHGCISHCLHHQQALEDIWLWVFKFQHFSEENWFPKFEVPKAWRLFSQTAFLNLHSHTPSPPVLNPKHKPSALWCCDSKNDSQKQRPLPMFRFEDRKVKLPSQVCWLRNGQHFQSALNPEVAKWNFWVLLQSCWLKIGNISTLDRTPNRTHWASLFENVGKIATCPLASSWVHNFETGTSEFSRKGVGKNWQHPSPFRNPQLDKNEQRIPKLWRRVIQNKDMQNEMSELFA